MRNKYQPEFALICALSIVTSLLLVYTAATKGWSPALSASPHVFFANFFGGPLFFTPFLVVGCYLVYKFSEMIVSHKKHKRLHPRRSSMLWNALAYLLFVGGFCALFALAVKLVFIAADEDWTAQASQGMMLWDYALFSRFTGGEYPAYALNFVGSFPLLEELALQSYSELMTLLGLLFGALFAFHPRLLRQFVFAIFLCGLLALPVWTILPSVSPHHLYGKNIFDVEVPMDIKASMKNHPPSPRLEEFLAASDLYWLDPDGQFYPVSSNPSMHMSWAVVLLVYSWAYASWSGQKLSWKGPQLLWAALILPWFILNTVGTIYTVQHYAVDLVSGVLIAVVAILLAKRALPITGTFSRLECPSCWLLVKEDLTRYLRYTKKPHAPNSKQR